MNEDTENRQVPRRSHGIELDDVLSNASETDDTNLTMDLGEMNVDVDGEENCLDSMTSGINKNRE